MLKLAELSERLGFSLDKPRTGNQRYKPTDVCILCDKCGKPGGVRFTGQLYKISEDPKVYRHVAC